MREFPLTQSAVLEIPFLVEPAWSIFTQKLSEVIQKIDAGAAVLCAEEDRLQALAVVFATVLKQGGLFLGNPKWQNAEWSQLDKLTGFDRIFGNCPLQPDPARSPRFGETRIMIPSGGTSGGIRYCVHSPDSLSAAVDGLHKFHGNKPLNSICVLEPFHVSGLMPVLRASLTGGRVAMADWKSLEEGVYPGFPGDPCSISLVPTQLVRLVQSEKGLRFLHGVDTIYVGGAGTPIDLVNRIRTEKLPVLFVYGMTETAAMVVAGSRADTDSSGNVWGRPLPGVSVSLSGEDEIILRTDALFHGYFPDDSRVKEYATGDLGQWTVDGQLQVVGRKDFLINTGGEKVSPEEVESVLAACLPGVAVAVTSRPDREWGQQVVGVIETELDERALEKLRQVLASQLAAHKVPRLFITGHPIPKTANGKINRAQLRTTISAR